MVPRSNGSSNGNTLSVIANGITHLEAAAAAVQQKQPQQNKKFDVLVVEQAARMTRRTLCALVDCLRSNSIITTMTLEGDRRQDNNDDSDSIDDDENDYTKFMLAIASSSSLKIIKMQGNLPLGMEQAIMEGLKRKKSFTTLVLKESLFIQRNPISFAKLLATGTGLGSLELQHSECYHDLHGRALRDGIRKSQSLQQISIESHANNDMGATLRCILEGLLAGNQSLEALRFQELKLDSTEAGLLNKFVVNHKNLKSLNVSISPDAVTALCHAVASRTSRPLTELAIRPYTCISALPRMVLQAASVLQTVMVDRNLTNIDRLPRQQPTKSPPRRLDIWKKVRAEEELKRLRTELQFYLDCNRQGQLWAGGTQVPLNVLSHLLAKAGRSSFPDALYYFLTLASSSLAIMEMTFADPNDDSDQWGADIIQNDSTDSIYIDLIT